MARSQAENKRGGGWKKGVRGGWFGRSLDADLFCMRVRGGWRGGGLCPTWLKKDRRGLALNWWVPAVLNAIYVFIRNKEIRIRSNGPLSSWHVAIFGCSFFQKVFLREVLSRFAARCTVKSGNSVMIYYYLRRHPLDPIFFCTWRVCVAILKGVGGGLAVGVAFSYPIQEYGEERDNFHIFHPFFSPFLHPSHPRFFLQVFIVTQKWGMQRREREAFLAFRTLR